MGEARKSHGEHSTINGNENLSVSILFEAFEITNGKVGSANDQEVFSPDEVRLRGLRGPVDAAIGSNGWEAFPGWGFGVGEGGHGRALWGGREPPRTGED